MNFLRNKIFIKIIASLCIVLTLMNMGMPNNVFAEDIYGGILIVPVTNLLVSICDGVIGLLHKTIQYQDLTLVEISGEPNWWNDFGKTAIATLVTVGIIAIAGVYFLPTLAAASGVLATLKVVVPAIVAVGVAQVITVELTGDGILHIGTFIAEKLGDWFSGTLYMPVYTITPRYIFSNQIRLFDINFFDPMDSETVIVDEKVKSINTDKVQVYYDTEENIEKDGLWADGIVSATELKDEIAIESQSNGNKNKILIKEFSEALDVTKVYSLQQIYEKLSEGSKDYLITIIADTNTKLEEAGKLAIPEDAQNTILIDWRKDELGEDSRLYSCAKIHLTMGTREQPMEIVILISTVLEEKTIQVEKTLHSSAEQLKGVIGEWYYKLRNLAMVMMLLILVYSGIRIVTGSTASQKAKYKERIQDWLVAFCLLFVMHYIMVFAIELCDRISDLLVSTKTESGITETIPLKQEHLESLNELSEKEASQEYKAFDSLGNLNGNELTWITDVMGKFRIWTQATEEGTIKWAGYAMCFILLTIYTVFFTWTYLKRVLQMAFLTVIAPFVAMTYPIDKINDGKAQAFSMWLKEYIFNLLIQPMHLLLYTILVSSAYNLVATNAMYSIVAMGFIMPAEQLVRKFFGFTKSQTAGALGGAAGAALAYSGLQKLTNVTKKLGGKEEKDKDDKTKDPKITGAGIKKHEVVADSIIGTGENDSSNISQPEGSRNARILNLPESSDDGASPADTEASPADPAVSPADPAVSPADPAVSPADPAANPADGKPTDEEEKTKKKRRKSPIQAITGVARATKGATGTYVRQLGTKMGKRIAKQRPIRALARATAGIYGGAAMGLAGVALGIASGDPNKAFQYGTAAAVGGYGAGKAVGGKVVDTFAVDTEKIKDEMKATYYGSEYKKKKLEKDIEKMSNNENNLWELRQYLPDMSRDEAKAMLSGDIGKRCYESGITDMKDIAAVCEAYRSGKMSIDEGIAGLKFSSQFPSKLKEMGQKERDNMVARWAKEYEEMKAQDPEKYKDLDPQLAAQRSLDLAEDINKIKGKLTDVPKE